MPDGMENSSSNSRRLAREVAFQAIYMTVIGNVGQETALTTAISRHNLSLSAQEFVKSVVHGVLENRQELDTHIEPLLASGWKLNRIAVSDHVILQIATYELFYIEEMPPKVTISQAVDLAKRFGTSESGSFVNGVLGSLLKRSPKAEWEAPIIVDTYDEEPETDIDLTEYLDDEPVEQTESEDAVKVGSWVIKRDLEEPATDEPI